MKLQQLRFLVAVADAGLNISVAARQLYTSQPGVSKQLRLLEDELGFALFERRGRSLVRLTPDGRKVLDHAVSIMREVQEIKGLAKDPRKNPSKLAVVATPLQARHALPWVIEDFSRRQPGISLEIRQSSGAEAIQRVTSGEAQFAIAEGKPQLTDGLLCLPWYRWRYRLLLPENGINRADLRDPEALARYPLIVCAADEEALIAVRRAFQERGLKPNITCTSDDPDVVLAQVRMGRGIGIVPEMVQASDDGHGVGEAQTSFFPQATTWVLMRRDLALLSHLRDFLTLLAPHLATAVIEQTQRPLAADKSVSKSVPAWAEEGRQ